MTPTDMMNDALELLYNHWVYLKDDERALVPVLSHWWLLDESVVQEGLKPENAVFLMSSMWRLLHALQWDLPDTCWIYHNAIIRMVALLTMRRPNPDTTPPPATVNTKPYTNPDNK